MKKRILSIVFSLCIGLVLNTQAVFADAADPICGEIDMEAFKEAHDNWLASEPKEEDFAETYNKAYDSWEDSKPDPADFVVDNPIYESKAEAEEQYYIDLEGWYERAPSVENFMSANNAIAYREALDTWKAKEPQTAYDKWLSEKPTAFGFMTEEEVAAYEAALKDYHESGKKEPFVEDFMANPEIDAYYAALADWDVMKPLYDDTETWRIAHNEWLSTKPDVASFLSEADTAAYEEAIAMTQDAGNLGPKPDFNDPKYSYDNSAEMYAEAMEEWNSKKPEFSLTEEEKADFEEAYEEWLSGEPVEDMFKVGHKLTKIEAREATVTETGNKEYWHCKDCGKYFADENGTKEIKLEDTIISKLSPEIIEGKGQSITAGEKKELTFKSNAVFSDFIRVELDGKTLDAKNYTVKEGSTVVTLKADYVSTLSAGEHTIGIVSESGTASTTFIVNAKAAVDNDTKSTQTGNNSHMALWIALLFMSGAGVIGATVYGKKKKRSVR